MATSTEPLSDAKRQRQLKAKADQLEIDIRDIHDSLQHTTCKHERRKLKDDIAYIESLLCEMCC